MFLAEYSGRFSHTLPQIFTSASTVSLGHQQPSRDEPCLSGVLNIATSLDAHYSTLCKTYCRLLPLYTYITAPQHLVCRAVQSLHTNHMQMSIIEVFICRRLHMNTSMILICIWLICRLCTALHTKCCGAVHTTFQTYVAQSRVQCCSAHF